mmetsp:Transcript_33261/g.106773  ORF Transcript_33261/g.106773 Transcript_33261/m.106773 type:complete len:228 (+) Transcript_33261:300-983(+)
MAALNYQAHDRAVWINQGKFAANGGCGWVLKPPRLLCDGSAAAALAPAPLLLRVSVLSGHDLQPPEPGRIERSLRSSRRSLFASEGSGGGGRPDSPGSPNRCKPPARKSAVDPFVVIEVAGAAADAADKCFARTQTVSGGGGNPEWGETFEFEVAEPDVAVLLLTVWDDDVLSADDFMGQYALPVRCLRRGVRCVPLRRADGTPHEGAPCLLVRVESESQKPEGKAT